VEGSFVSGLESKRQTL